MMRFGSAPPSLGIILSREKTASSLQVKREELSMVEEFKYLSVLFTSEGKSDWGGIPKDKPRTCWLFLPAGLGSLLG